MHPAYISFIIGLLVVLAISTDAQADDKDDCPKFCTFEYDPVCGYNGTCYRKFGNACTLNIERCSNENYKNLKDVNMELCEEALSKSNPEVVTCNIDNE